MTEPTWWMEEPAGREQRIRMLVDTERRHQQLCAALAALEAEMRRFADTYAHKGQGIITGKWADRLAALLKEHQP